MKTLSIKNPWAYLVAFGVKDVENRSWKTDYRGELLIHCSGDPIDFIDTGDVPEGFYKQLSALNDEGINAYSVCEHHPPQIQNWWKLYMMCLNHLGVKDRVCDGFWRDVKEAIKARGFPMPSQAIIGKVNLVDIVDDSDSVWAEPHQYHWILSDAGPFDKPILGVKGKIRFWNYDLT